MAKKRLRMDIRRKPGVDIIFSENDRHSWKRIHTGGTCADGKGRISFFEMIHAGEIAEIRSCGLAEKPSGPWIIFAGGLIEEDFSFIIPGHRNQTAVK